MTVGWFLPKKQGAKIWVWIHVTSQDFIKFWGNFFAFISYVLIENSQRIKNFWDYLKALIENYFQTPCYFLKNFFEKTKYQNIIFLLLLNFMQACLQKIVLQNCFIQYRFAFSKLWLSVILHHYFINYYSTILKRIDFNP
jgi:hypothetical protein